MASKNFPSDAILKAILDQEQNTISDFRQTLVNENIATPNRGAKVIEGRIREGNLETNLLSEIADCTDMKYTSHRPEDTNGIVVDLGKLYEFNQILLLPFQRKDNSIHWKFSYRIDVSRSRQDWTTAVDSQTNGKMNDWKGHLFEIQKARFIRLTGKNVTGITSNVLLTSLKVYLKKL